LAIFFSIYDWLHYIQLIGGYTMSCFTHLVLCEDEVMRVQIFTECYYANNNYGERYVRQPRVGCNQIF